MYSSLKLEWLVALCHDMLHPQLIEEKFWVIFFSTHDSMKHPEMHKKVGTFFWRSTKILNEKNFG